MSALSGRLAALGGTLAAPWRLVHLCSRAQTRRAIADAAEMVALQWHGGLTVVTDAGGPSDSGSVEAQPVLRSLIQLDGDVVVTIDRLWLERVKGQAPGQLEQALARHAAAIARALEPLQQGFLTASRVLTLAGRSRWSILGVGGLSQGGALFLAPSIAGAGSFHAWLAAAAGQIEVVLLQSLSAVLFILVGVVRLGLRWWIRGRLRKRLPGLIERLTQDSLQTARERAYDAGRAR